MNPTQTLFRAVTLPTLRIGVILCALPLIIATTETTLDSSPLPFLSRLARSTLQTAYLLPPLALILSITRLSIARTLLSLRTLGIHRSQILLSALCASAILCLLYALQLTLLSSFLPPEDTAHITPSLTPDGWVHLPEGTQVHSQPLEVHPDTLDIRTPSATRPRPTPRSTPIWMFLHVYFSGVLSSVGGFWLPERTKVYTRADQIALGVRASVVLILVAVTLRAVLDVAFASGLFGPWEVAGGFFVGWCVCFGLWWAAERAAVRL